MGIKHAKSSSRATQTQTIINCSWAGTEDEHSCMWDADHRCACAGRVCSGIFRACASRFPYSRWQPCTLLRSCLFSEKPQTSTRSAFPTCYGGDGEKFCAQTLRRSRRWGKHGGRKLLLCGRDTREASRRQSGTRRDGESESESESERASEIEAIITFTFFVLVCLTGKRESLFCTRWCAHKQHLLSGLEFRV